ncbi:MAG: hypothetical protein ACPG7U_00050 [Holosporaceae bacterium]
MTQLMYATEPTLFETAATVQNSGHDTKGAYLTFDRSVFYPQGGGQPADQGNILLDHNTYFVCDVRQTDEEVRHYLTQAPPLNSQKQPVTMRIDPKRRHLNTRYHTAGHLVAAVANALSSDIKAVKGHQFPNEAYVGFEGTLLDAKAFLVSLEANIQEHLAKATCVVTRYLEEAEVDAFIKKLPYKLPTSKQLRVCDIKGISCDPCGGTHVQNLQDIGPIAITHCKSKKGKTKIGYQLTP